MQFLIATGVGTIVGVVLANILNAIAARSSQPLLRACAGRIRTPIFVLSFIYGAKFGINAFDIAANVALQIHQAITVVIFLIITWGLNHIYDSIQENILIPWGQRKDNVTLINVCGTLAHVLIWSLGIISGLNSAGYNVSTILAGLGIGGLAFALAAQDTVSNIFGGIVVLTQNPFRVGDRIEVKGISGWVGNIGLRSTVIDTWMGYRVTVPNKLFTDSPVTNVYARKLYWENLQLKLRHDASLAQVERVQEILREIIDAHPHLAKGSWVGVCKIGEGFIEIECWYGINLWNSDEKDNYADEYTKQLGVKSEIHMQILKALEDENVKLFVPLQRHLVSEPPADAEARF